MKQDSLISRILFGLSVIGLALMLCGTKACQEDYELGTQSSLSETPTATPTDDDDDDLTTPTPTTSTDTPTPTPTIETGASQAFLRALGGLSASSSDTSSRSAAPGAAPGRGGQSGTGGRPQNWLGNIKNGGAENGVDTDGDGLSDSLEQNLGLNITQPDSDQDGLIDGAELAFGTNPLLPDTDSDGILDGAEVTGDPVVADAAN